jgi:hypothetical protein
MTTDEDRKARARLRAKLQYAEKTGKCPTGTTELEWAMAKQDLIHERERKRLKRIADEERQLARRGLMRPVR